MAAIQRKAARYRVHLQVRYAAAADFVREYAENLSRGGLFLRGGRGLSRRRDVEVDVELPGLGHFRVRAEVAHVIDAEEASRAGRAAGVGLAIVEAPPGFEAAMEAYLGRLERRGEVTLAVIGDEATRLLAEAGYKVERLDGAPSAATLAVVVPVSDVTAATALAGAVPVFAMDAARELDRVLAALDARL